MGGAEAHVRSTTGDRWECEPFTSVDACSGRKPAQCCASRSVVHQEVWSTHLHTRTVLYSFCKQTVVEFL